MLGATFIRMTSVALGIAASFTALASPARAQAYVPAQGEGAVSVMYSDQFFRYHFSPTTATDAGQIYARSMLFDVTYGLTDRVAISVGLPLVATRYTGPSPHPLPDFSGPNPIDDGTWHATAQDFRFDIRYNVTRNLLNKGIVFTPFVGSIVPSHDYPYFVHSGFGKDLREVQGGVSVAKLFERGIPGLIVQGRYSFGFTEQAVDIPHNRSLASIEVGYFATPKLRLMGLSSGQRTHGGIDFYGATSRALLTPEQFLHHDQITRENYLALGGGASYSITETIDIYGSVLHDVARRNGHGLTRGVNLGLSYSFSTSHARKIAADRTAEGSLAKCLCEKGTK
jgi:hypothetical protein